MPETVFGQNIVQRLIEGTTRHRISFLVGVSEADGAVDWSQFRSGALHVEDAPATDPANRT